MRYGWVRVALVAAVLATAACNRGSAPAGSDAANAEALAAATAFMTSNAKADGVQSLPTGVQYKVVQSGPAGGVSPDRNDLVRVDYEGSLTDGTVFDSSFKRGVPAVFRLNEVVAGWADVISHMKPGDEWIAYIPPDRGYGEEDKGDIPPNSALVFRIKLLDVAPEPGDAPPPDAAMG
jgi:peptidylprolyl isomerase/FKBP-type peptidyl-prolyl cis-trans isomerase FklB